MISAKARVIGTKYFMPKTHQSAGIGRAEDRSLGTGLTLSAYAENRHMI